MKNPELAMTHLQKQSGRKEPNGIEKIFQAKFPFLFFPVML
jgi:hypothetical protein